MSMKKSAPVWLLRISAAAAAFSLVTEFGFNLSASTLDILHAVDFVVVAVFLMVQTANLTIESDWRSRLKRCWLEAFLITLLLIYSIWHSMLAARLSLNRNYVEFAQTYLVLKMVLGAFRANQRITASPKRPAVILVGSFLLLIVIGTGLISMPRCQTQPWSIMDALFTSTSAVCVTGLSVRDIGTSLTGRGQGVLLGLIQIGGLGLVTFAMAITYLQQGAFNLQQKAMMRELLSAQAISNLGRVLARVLIITFVVELLGAALLFHARDDLPFSSRLWWAIFHSVSAFCNAGFALSRDSLMPDARSPGILLSIAFLITLGGIGFPVILDFLRIEVTSLSMFRRWNWKLGALPRGPVASLRLHTKLAVVTSGVLLVAGTVLFMLSEHHHSLSGQSFTDRLLCSFFQSVTARTAGFNSVDMGALQVPTLLLIMVLMVIGASPASTGGGVKTTSVAVLWLTVRSMMRMRESVEAYGRSVPRSGVNSAVAVIALYGGTTIVTTALLAATHPSLRFIDVLFESISALSTVGLSTGVTAKLNDSGKIILCVAMLVGRVGPLAIIWTLLARPPSLRYEYPQEEVVIS